MTRRDVLRLARRALDLPTAPTHEEAVRDLVARWCADLGAEVGTDRAGNVVARLRPNAGPRGGAARIPPIAFAAHMDHPGFEATGRNRVEFLGGVPRDMLRHARMRFAAADGVVSARAVRVLRRAKGRAPALEVAADGPLSKGDWGTWDLPRSEVVRGRLHAVGIDDVLGVAALLAALSDLAGVRRRAPVWALFTRAEEIGFLGAIALARSGVLPRRSLVVSIENSPERPGVNSGAGPIVRVGDRASVFDPRGTLFLEHVARQDRVVFQRALMDGGTCEATAFAAYGYRAVGVTIALRNYHNIGPGRRPRRESVDVRDLCGLVALLAAAGSRWTGWPAAAGLLRARVDAIAASAPRQLAGHGRPVAGIAP